MVLKIEDIGIPIETPLDKAEQSRVDNSLFYANQLGVASETAYDLEPELNVEYFGKEVVTAEPAKMLKDAFLQSLASKPAMMLRGSQVYTPGKALGLDPLLDKASTAIESLKDPELEKKLQQAASGKLWPIGDDSRWWQVERKYLPEVINAWAANVGDQIPILLTTMAGRMAGKVIGKPIGVAAGIAAAAITGGPDPSDVATAPAVVGVTQEVIKHLGGAAPMIAMEAGAFMDDSESLEIDLDIAEKYARLYGVGSGAIEYAQQLWVLGRYSKIAKPAQDTILKQVLSHIGGSVFEGLEEISQGGLENFLLQKAVSEMKQRHPDYDKEAPNITEGWERNGAIGTGVAAITGLPGTGMSISKGQLARLNQVSPETKKFMGEPSVSEIAPTEPVPAPEPVAKPITPTKPPITPAEGEVEISRQEEFKGAAKIVLSQPNTTISQLSLGKEELIETREGFFTTVARGGPKKGQDISFVLEKWQADDGRIRYIAKFSDEGKVSDFVSAAAQIKIIDGVPEIQTVASAETKIGLGTALVQEIQKDFGDFTFKEPVSKAGARLLQRVGKLTPTPAKAEAKPVEKKEEVEAPKEAKKAEQELEAEAAEEIEPELYIGHVTEGMKRRIEKKTQFKAEDIQGFKKGAFPTIRTKIKMARGEAEQYLEFLENKIIDDLDNNRIRTENDLARLNAEWGDITALRKVLGIPKGKAPFRVMRAGKHKVEIIESVKARIKEAVRPTIESKMTVGEVLTTVMRRTARATKMGFVTGRKELRAQIRAKKRAKKRMNKAIKTIGQKISSRVDFFYREAIEALREGIDLASRSEKTLAQRKATAEFIKRVPEKVKDIPVKLMKQIHQKPLNEFTIEELEEVATEVEKLVEQGRLKRSLKMKPQLEERKRNIAELTANTESVKPSRVKIGPKVVSTTKQGLMETVFDKIKAWTWTPQRLFDMLDGGKNFSGLWHKIFYDDPKTAKRKAIRKSMERRNAGLDKMKELGLSMYQLSGSRIIGEVKYSIQELMGIYMGSKNRLSKLVLRYGHELSDADITNAINALTPQEKELADFMLEDYEENYSRLRRSVIEQENRDAPAEENYSPIRRTGDFSKTLESEIIDSMLRREQVRRHNVAHGFTLERKDVPKELQTPMRLDAINVWLDQVEKQERYINIGPQVRNMNKILANKELRRTVGNRFGESILKTLDGYVSSVANPYVYKHFNDTERASSYLRRNAVIAYLGFNFVTMGKQLPSAFLYLPDAGPSHLIASALDFATNPMAMIKKVRELDPQLANRSLERELEEIKNAPNANFIKSKIGQYGLEGIYLFDTIARTIGWNAVYERALADDKSPAEAVRLAQNATLRTQPAAAAEDIPALYRTNEFLNWFTMFTNQLNKLFNITTYDIPSYIKNEEYSKAALQSIGMGIVALTIWAVTNRALPDEPEEFIEAIGEQAINMIPVFGKPIMAARKGWDADIPLFEGVKGLAKATTDLELTRRDVEAVAEGIAVTTGIPYTAIRRGIQAIEEKQPSAIFGARRPPKQGRGRRTSARR